jgi:hypothetical protein
MYGNLFSRSPTSINHMALRTNTMATLPVRSLLIHILILYFQKAFNLPLHGKCAVFEKLKDDFGVCLPFAGLDIKNSNISAS